MNEKICKTIVEHREQFVPHLFTERQVQLISKWLNKEKMTKTEQTYLYATITKKVDALSMFREEFYITGDHMIPERVEEAKKILKKMTKQAFISGSFLFAEKYNDIDLFIISNKRKETYEGKFHHILIKEKDLAKPAFQSAAMSCISNFDIILPKRNIKRLHLGQTMNAYQEVIINLLENNEIKTVKGILADYSLHVLRKLLSSCELNKEYDTLIKRDDRISIVSDMVKKLIMHTFSRKYLFQVLKRYITMLKKDIPTIKLNDHLKIYKKTYEEILYECTRTEKYTG